MILITGATGNVGREVVKLLLARGAKVAAVTRHPTAAVLPRGATIVRGDPSDPKTVASALNDVEAILISPRAVGAATTELLSLAASHGVDRVTILSAATVEYPAGLPRFAEEFKAAEDAAKGSGLRWTLLRSTDYASNTLAWAPQIRSTGAVRGAYGQAATSTVHERDVAAVAARTLSSSEHEGRSYVLTGPQSLTQYDKVRTLGEAIGSELSFQELPPERVRQAMLAQGLPEEIPDRLLGSLADYAKHPGPSSATVEQILGRPALTFADWAVEHADAFRTVPERSRV